MNILKTKGFSKWASLEAVDDRLLLKTIQELKDGLVDAHLGGGLYKKRIARLGGGKRSGYRTIIGFKKGDLLIFLLAFAKNRRENITLSELKALKRLMLVLSGLTPDERIQLVKKGEFEEVSL